MYKLIFLFLVAAAHAQSKTDIENDKRIELLEKLVSKLNKQNHAEHSGHMKLEGQISSLKNEIKVLGEGEASQAIEILGQSTLIYQSSNYHKHKNYTATLSADLVFEKKLKHGFYQLDLQYANGGGVDANEQGGAMVNNDVMEDVNQHNQPYIAKAFYEHKFELPKEYNITFDIGKFGVNDFFDTGIQVSDQTTQFLNQAINNNGAFDYSQDLQGHGYTYGLHTFLGNDNWGMDLAVFSADSYLDNIDRKHSVLAGLKWTPEWVEGHRSFYQIYTFKNHGEYGEFASDGTFITSNASQINTSNNSDEHSKAGFGINLNHTFPNDIDVFFKYGGQDDNRDVRHYQDMDRTLMFGAAVQGGAWSREFDALGIAYEIGQLTGNHRKAHELGYTSFFNRSTGIGTGNYKNETVFEMYYRFSVNDYSNISLDFQNITNLKYDKTAKNAKFYATRFI